MTDRHPTGARSPRITTLRSRISSVPRTLPALADAFPEHRGSGSAWQKIRRRQLQREPLCRHCTALHLVTAAQEVDHMVPLYRGGTHDETNLQSLCIPHHRAKTQAEERERYSIT